VLYTTNQTYVSLSQVTEAPSLGHLLGTDENGYDVLGRLMYGGQTSLEVGLAGAAIATCVGVVWGAIAGYFGGIVDALMMRIVDSLLALPALLLVLFLASIWTPTLFIMIVVVAIVAWLVPARLVRGETLSLRVREYVQAAKGMGGHAPRIIFRHIVPNVVGTVIVNATFQVADAILLVAGLSYLGLGIPPPAANWGGMLSDGLNYVQDGYWWLVYPAGFAIVATVVAFNLIGDALRDAFEVRLRSL
jgi:peptide/nickel transport system permease protein